MKPLIFLSLVALSFVTYSQTIPVTLAGSNGEQSINIPYDSIFGENSYYFPTKDDNTVDLKIFDQKFVLLNREKSGNNRIYEYIQQGTISLVRGLDKNPDWFVIKDGKWFKISSSKNQQISEEQQLNVLKSVLKQTTANCDTDLKLDKLDYSFKDTREAVNLFNETCGEITFDLKPDLPLYPEEVKKKGNPHSVLLIDSTSIEGISIEQSNIPNYFKLQGHLYLSTDQILTIDGKDKSELNAEQLSLEEVQRGRVALLITHNSIGNPSRIFIEKDNEIHELINTRKAHSNTYIYSKEYIGTLNILLGDSISYQEISSTNFDYRSISQLVNQYNKLFPENEALENSDKIFKLKVDEFQALFQINSGEFKYSTTKLPVKYISQGIGMSISCHSESLPELGIIYSLGYYLHNGDGSTIPLYGKPYYIDYKVHSVRQSIGLEYLFSVGNHFGFGPIATIGLDHQISNKSYANILYNDVNPDKVDWPQESILKTDLQTSVGLKIYWKQFNVSAQRMGVNRGMKEDGVYTQIISGHENQFRLSYIYKFR